MTVTQAPLFLENVGLNHHAAEMRRAYGDLLGGRFGVVNQGDGVVTPNATPNQTVWIAPMRAIIPGTQTLLQGPYHLTNDAAYQLTMPAADSANPRVDLVVARVADSFYTGGASDTGTIEPVIGTPGANPSPPAAPDNSIILAQVARATAAGGGNVIQAANITDKRPLFSKFIGTWLTAGAPSIAAIAGDFGFDLNNLLWVCSVTGNPATFVPMSSVRFASFVPTGSAFTQTVPAGFNAIRMRWSFSGSTNGTVAMQINGDAGPNYFSEFVVATTTVSPFETVNGNSFGVDCGTAPNGVAGEMIFHNYAGRIVVSGNYGGLLSGTAARAGYHGCLWTGAGPISSISGSLSPGTFSAPSRVSFAGEI